MGKGIVLTTDAALAVTAALAVIVASSYYVQEANRSRWGGVNMVKTAYDLALALDREGVLSSNNDTWVEAALEDILPPNMAASLEVHRYMLENDTLVVVSDRRYGVDLNGDSAAAEVLSVDGRGGCYMSYLKVGWK